MSKYKVTYGDNEFDASEYQDAIFDYVEHGTGDMVVKAAAGSAKTTTIVNCIDIIPKTKRVLFIAFNKDIVETIKKKIKNKENSKICTFHSLGRSIFCEHNGNLKEGQLNEFKYKNYIENHIDELLGDCNLEGNRRTYTSNIIQLVDFSRHSLVFREDEIRDIAEKYGIIPISNEISATRKVLKWGKNNLETIDFTDMIWLTNVLNYTTHKYQFDWILVDEAQDITVSQQNMLQKCYRRGCRVLVVGDDNQRINVWCGSDENAIENLKRYKDSTRHFMLPITYRNPKAVVRLANRIISNKIGGSEIKEIQTPKDAIEGEIRMDVSKFSPKDGDMVLCRITAPLVALYMEYLRRNMPCYIRGHEDIRDEYFNVIEQYDSELIDVEMETGDGLFTKLYKNLYQTVKSAEEVFNLSESDALLHSSVLRLYDIMLSLKVLSEGLTTTEQLRTRIRDVFSVNRTDGIQLTTVHKAKGLETDNVFILMPSLMPMRHAKKDWEREAEENLIYVAVTRCKKTLNYIKEDEQWKRAYEQNIYLGAIKNKIKQGEETPTKIHVETPTTHTIHESKPKIKAGHKFRNIF